MVEIEPGATKEQIQDAINQGGVAFTEGKHTIPVSPGSPGMILKSGTAICGGPNTEIHFDGEGIGIHGFECKDVLINGIETHYKTTSFSNWNMHIDLRGCEMVQVVGCRMIAGNFGVRAGRGGNDRYGSASQPSNNIMVNGCTIYGVNLVGVLTKFGGCNRMEIVGNSIRSSDSGIAYQNFPMDGSEGTCSNCSIIGNVVDACNNGIVISGNKVWCRENDITSFSSSGSAVGIRLTTDPLRLRWQKYRFARVRDNIINIAGVRAFGVLLERSRNSSFTDVDVSGNSVITDSFRKERPHEEYATMFVESDGENDFLTTMKCDRDVAKYRTKDWKVIERESGK